MSQDAPVSKLTTANWHLAAINAIERLPKDIASNVRYTRLNDRAMEVRVAVAPVDPAQDGNTQVHAVVVAYWDRLRDKLDQDEAQCPGCGSAASTAAQTETLDGPVVSVTSSEHCAQEPAACLVVNVATVRRLRREVQVRILEEMWGSGGFSMFDKDHKGRCIREDGSPVLKWQFRRKRVPTPLERVQRDVARLTDAEWAQLGQWIKDKGQRSAAGQAEGTSGKLRREKRKGG